MQYANPEEDKFFEVRGAKPPERIPHLTEEDIEAKLEANRRTRVCRWEQHGPELRCTSCPQRHGMFVGTDQLMVGINTSGLPILKQVLKS